MPVYPDHFLRHTIIIPSSFTYLFLVLKFKFKSILHDQTRCSNMFSVRLFHKFVIFKLFKLFLTFDLDYNLANSTLCPLVTFCLHGCKYNVAAISYFLFRILYVSIMSPRDLLYTRAGRSRYLKLSSQVKFFIFLLFWLFCTVHFQQITSFFMETGETEHIQDVVSPII